MQTLQASDGLQPPVPLSRGLTALLLTLLDTETSLHFSDALGSEAAWMYARFHTGAQRVGDASSADFAVVRAAEAQLDALQLGSDEAPQSGATLIVDVPSLAIERHASLRLTGPGIEHECR